MKTGVYAPAELSPELQAHWRSLQLAHPLFAGPCFHPRLFAALAEFIPGIRVAVATHDSGARGFLPFLQLDRERIALPIPACDYQAIIADPAIRWDVRAILRDLDLNAWDFETLTCATAVLPPSIVTRSRSPRVVLDDGHDQYLQQQKNAGKSGRNLKEHRRFLQRDRGQIRFVVQANDLAVLALLAQWKADRFHGFAGWASGVMELIHSRSDGEFSGILSVLYAGDSAVAAHFGLRCDGILHYWFPGFNPEFSRYSASRLLMQDLISALPSLQCGVLDLGPGGESYKDYFANASIEVLAGHHERPGLWTGRRKLLRGLRDLVRGNPLLLRAARPLVHLARRVFGQSREK